jgi:hypothetical protein
MQSIDIDLDGQLSRMEFEIWFELNWNCARFNSIATLMANFGRKDGRPEPIA